MLISSASSCCKQASVKRTPVYGFYGCCMLAKLGQWSCRCTLSHIPDHQFVVISTRSEHGLIVRTPPQSTDFLHMAGKSLTLRLSLRSSDVTHLNGLIFATTSHKRILPGTRTDSLSMTLHISHLSLFLDIPNLYVPSMSSNAQMRSFLGPSDGRHSVSLA